MASMKKRGQSYQVRWVKGRGTRFQNCTFPEAEQAIAAKALAEAHQHAISSADVYKAVFGLDVAEAEDATLTPTLAEWIERWLEKKVDVAKTTHAEYGRLLRSRVIPCLVRQPPLVS